jgi:hypothetical protein
VSELKGNLSELEKVHASRDSIIGRVLNICRCILTVPDLSRLILIYILVLCHFREMPQCASQCSNSDVKCSVKSVYIPYDTFYKSKHHDWAHSSQIASVLFFLNYLGGRVRI